MGTWSGLKGLTSWVGGHRLESNDVLKGNILAVGERQRENAGSAEKGCPGAESVPRGHQGIRTRKEGCGAKQVKVKP